MALLPNYYKWTYGRFREVLQGRVMEVGCGAGLGFATYLDVADEIYAVDHNEALLTEVARRYSSPKIHTICADLIDDWSGVGVTALDTVVMMDVLEHFEDDERLAREAVARLKAGGRLAVKVPAHSHLFSEMDVASGHYRRYDRNDLERIATASGTRLLHARFINPLGALMYALRRQRKTNFSRSFKPWQLRVINQTLPMLAYLDALPIEAGLSIMAVFERGPTHAPPP